MEEVSTLSELQDKALSILPCITSLLSCFGSAQIIFMVVTARKTTPYRRILLGLSCSDFLCSLIYPWQAFLVPAATSPRVWAIGNDPTCSFLGFAQQIIFASILYNSMLSLYFLLTVRCGISNPQVGKKYEPWMHLLSIGYPLIAACIGLGFGVFNELEIGHGCWVNDYPKGCGVCGEDTTTATGDTNDCSATSTCTDNIFAIVFGGVPAMLAFGMILVNNILVYLYVKNTIQKVRKRFKSSTLHQIASAAATTAAPSAALTAGNSSSNNTNSTGTRPALSVARRSIKRAIGRRLSSKSRAAADPQLQRIRAVFNQACWYVVAFMLTYLASFVLRILESIGYDAQDEAKLFPLLVLEAILLPSQGWFNLFVYIRPSFWRTRRDYPNESYWWVFRRALYGERIKPVRDEAKRRPSSSDFGLMVVHRLQATQGRSILHGYGMQGMYDPYWSGDDVLLSEHNVDQIDDADEIESFAGEDPSPQRSNPLSSRRTEEACYSVDDNDVVLEEDVSDNTEVGYLPVARTAEPSSVITNPTTVPTEDETSKLNDGDNLVSIGNGKTSSSRDQTAESIEKSDGCQTEENQPPAIDEQTGR